MKVSVRYRFSSGPDVAVVLGYVDGSVEGECLG
jgi:hypothetical protein